MTSSWWIQNAYELGKQDATNDKDEFSRSFDPETLLNIFEAYVAIGYLKNHQKQCYLSGYRSVTTL